MLTMLSSDEDIVGIRELLEAFAVIRPFYHIQRRSMGKLSTLASQLLFAQETSAAVQYRETVSTDQNVFGGALGLDIHRNVDQALAGLKEFRPNTVSDT